MGQPIPYFERDLNIIWILEGSQSFTTIEEEK